jgi:uncharacterized protein YndB with AHSA1/START domain
MTEERMTATITIQAPVQDVFDVLADPSTHEERRHRWCASRSTANR